MIGTTVGKYRITERLGRGGMGIVYKALDESLYREVAIKVLNPDITDTELMKRFRVEAMSLARLNHPGIATIYELHQHGDDLLMVMEYVRGETLQSLSERLGPLDPPQAAHICTQILDALAHAHRAGIVHRDLKPANVMVGDTGVVKIMDFGIARMLGGESFTNAGYMMGTPAYMAPEQVLGQDIDGRADLYSVGVLFYRLLTRELPFQADTAIAMAQKQVAEAPTPLGTFRPNLPPWCEAIISKALQKAPSDRFQSAEAFRSAITSAVTPAALGDLPTMLTPTPAALKTSDMTMPLVGGSQTVATRPMTDPVASAAVAVPAASGSGPATPGSGVPAVERTGTTVVLGRAHLFTLAAMLVVLVSGIVGLGYLALKRGGIAFQEAPPPATAMTTPETTAAEQTPQTASEQAQPPLPEGESAKPDPLEPPRVPQQVSSSAPATPTAGSTAAAAGPPPSRAAGPAKETRKPAADVPSMTFKDVRVLVSAGKSMRDRDAVLTLAGDHLSVRDGSDEAEIVSLPYAAIQQAYYSRSKEPKWTDAEGKAQEVSVDLGRLGFFRGERNWLILTTKAEPVFLRFENEQMNAILSAVQGRTGLTIQR
ncbi:MAG TPA: protein kinase [Vicinamibacterales bacterium]